MRENHPGWALLRADHAPLVIAFFATAFLDPNRRNLPRRELIDSLEDVLFMVRDQQGDTAFPRSAAEYLDNWAAPEKAWLRKFYIENQDDPIFDLTPTTEDAVRWVQSLQGREFVATQSRLTGIFALLKSLVQGSETGTGQLELRAWAHRECLRVGRRGFSVVQSVRSAFSTLRPTAELSSSAW
jgi:hypothetical protein